MAFQKLILGICLLVLLAALHTNAAPATAKPGERIATGDIRSSNGYYSVVFYYAPKPAKETLATARMLAERLLPTVSFSTAKNERFPSIHFEEEQSPLKNFPVPDAAYFKFAGRGLKAEDIAEFQKTVQATRLVLVAPKDEVWTLGRKFTELVHEYAVTTGAYIWDSATRECFSHDAWKEKRLSEWSHDGIPNVTHQFTIHLYRIDEKSSYLRAITLGMEKFALPDVVIERMIGSDNRPAGNLINLVCQSLAEQPVVKMGEKEMFRIAALKAEALRTNMETSLEKGATKEIALALLHGQPQDGDPDNRLVEISFQNGEGSSEDERRQNLLSKLWGSTDSIIGVKHTEEILEASKRARAKLGDLRTSFQKGLPPGSRLLVKAPFGRDDEGNEWMWVEVMKWPEDESIEGILQNDPFYIRSLKAGANVRLKTPEVFDYLLHREDGTTEGNETGKLMEKQGGPEKSKG